MIREVRFANHVKTFDAAHEIVVDPESAHRVMHCGVNAHRNLVRIFIGDALVHLEQIAVALANYILTKSFDRVRKIEIDTEPTLAYTTTFVAHLLGPARSDVSRSEIPETGILPLQVVITLALRDLRRRSLVAFLLRHPHAPVVSERLAHQRELRLMLATHGNARRMNLGEARIGERSASLVCPPDGSRIRAFCVRREIEYVAVSAGTKHYSIGNVRLDFSGHEISCHDPSRATIDHNEIQHLGARIHRDGLRVDLPLESLIRAEQELLARLAARVERP